MSYVDLRINGRMWRDVHANFDSGADFNCIYPDYVPTKLWGKCSHKVTIVNGQILSIKWMVWNAEVATEGIVQRLTSSS